MSLVSAHHQEDTMSKPDTIEATRTAPSSYSVNTARVEQGQVFRFAAPALTETFEVVGEPITVGWCLVNVRVREVGGTHDGNEFGAYLYTR
jgi:hypothetical protein